MRIELLTSPGCPHAAAARRTVAEALTMLGMDVPIVDRVGRFPSPTVLVDGVDVTRLAAGPATAYACRLDLPTPQHVVDAIRAHIGGDPLETTSCPISTTAPNCARRPAPGWQGLANPGAQ